MAGFGDVLGSLFGQQSAPQATILDPAQAYNQGIATATSGIPALNNYNNALAAGQTQTGLNTQNTIYGPDANALQKGAISSVLNNLNLGSSLSPALTADINRKLAETNAGTGFGYSAAGTGNAILQTGLEANALQRQRQSDALNAIQGLPMSHFQYQNDRGLTPDAATNLAYETQAAKDNLANVQEQTRQDNFSALLNTGTKILGGIAGGIAGGGPGAIAGASAGSQIFGRAGGAGALGGLFNIGGPQNGIGAGRSYADANGDIQQSALATPIAGFSTPTSNFGSLASSGFGYNPGQFAL